MRTVVVLASLERIADERALGQPFGLAVAVVVVVVVAAAVAATIAVAMGLVDRVDHLAAVGELVAGP